MSLILNESGHWQTPDGSELWTGDQVEIYLDGGWVSGEINYRPQGEFQIRFENGKILEITEALTMRISNRNELKKSGKMDRASTT